MFRMALAGLANALGTHHKPTGVFNPLFLLPIQPSADDAPQHQPETPAMPLRLVSAGEQLPPAQPITPLSPAREALAGHLGLMAAALQEFERLQRNRDIAADAQLALDDANEQLSLVADLEREQWLAFVESGARSTPPQPLDDQRAKKAAEVAEAHARHELAQRRADAAEPAILAAWERYLALAHQRRALVAGVVCEEADRIAGLYEEAVRQCQRCEFALGGLREAMTRLGDAASAGYVLNRVRRGHQEVYGVPLLDKGEAKAIQACGIRFTDELLLNPRATVSISEE